MKITAEVDIPLGDFDEKIKGIITHTLDPVIRLNIETNETKSVICLTPNEAENLINSINKALIRFQKMIELRRKINEENNTFVFTKENVNNYLQEPVKCTCVINNSLEHNVRLTFTSNLYDNDNCFLDKNMPFEDVVKYLRNVR